MKTPELTQPDTSKILPYTPSYIDRFMGFIARLPVPYWLTYLTLFILESFINHILAWIDGWVPAYQLNPILLLFPIWLWGPLAIMTYLNLVSREALSSYKPLLDVDEQELRRLKDEFTTMPARSVILSGVIWAIVYVILNYLTYESFYVAFGLGTLFALFTFFEGLVSYFIGGAIYYHSFRQLRLVSSIVKGIKHINMFHLDPVYAFSRLTSRTGIGWMIMLSLTLLCYPIQISNAPVLMILILQVVLALAAFILPLQIVNRHLVAEKRKLLAEHNQHVKLAIQRLHRCLDEDAVDQMTELNNAMNGLNTEYTMLTRIPTWPWRVGTLTSFLSAVGLPIALFLIQLIIRRFLGG